MMDLLSFMLVYPATLKANCEREILFEKEEGCALLLKQSNVHGEERSFSKMQPHGKFRGSTLPGRLGSSHCQISWVACKESIFRMQDRTEINKQQTFRKGYPPTLCRVINLETLLISTLSFFILLFFVLV